MDIWRWVSEVETELRESGHRRLADIMESLPGWVVDNHHHKVDAVINEARTLAKKQNNKWVDVFVRHWHLQSNVLHRRNAKGMLNEAVDLLDFSHREETQNCPQSICAVQDLANCYGIADGKGYADERIAVCNESFSRIDPHWPCFDCIATEYIGALVDKGDFALAQQELNRLKGDMLKAGKPANESSLVEVEFQILLNCQDYANLLKTAQGAENIYGGESFLNLKQIHMALALAGLGDVDKAMKHLPTYDVIQNSPKLYVPWALTHLLLAEKQPSSNSSLVHNRLRAQQRKLEEHGALTELIELLFVQVEMAVMREDFYSAEISIHTLDSAINRLLKPELEQEKFAVLNRRYQKALEKRLPSLSLEQFNALDVDERDKLTLSTLNQLLTSNPDESAVISQFIKSLAANGLVLEADLRFASLLQKTVNRAELFLDYGFFLLDELPEKLEVTFSEFLTLTLTDEEKVNVCWILGVYFYEKDLKKAKGYLDQVVALESEATNAIKKLAWVETKLGHYSVAIQHFDRLLALSDNDIGYHWDRMIPAVAEERWDIVRLSAAEIGFDLQSEEGIIDENLGTVRVQIEVGGESQTYFAKRTSPVTARITEINGPGEKQFFGDTVIFDASPLNSLDQVDEDGYKCDVEGYYSYLYKAVIHQRVPEAIVFALDGVHPGKENLSELQSNLYSMGLGLSIRSGDQYKLTEHPSNQDLLGVYAYVAVPVGVDLGSVLTMLEDTTSSYEHPLIWPLLSHKLGDEAGLAKQAAIEKRYGIED